MQKKMIVLLVFLLVLSLHTGGQIMGQENQHELEFGCMPDGSVFDNFYPDGVKLREVHFVTGFGTLNTNIVAGQKLSTEAAIAMGNLAGSMGEFLLSINTMSMGSPLILMDSMVPQKYLQEKTMILCGGPKVNSLVKTLVQNGKSKVDWSKEDQGKIEIIDKAFGGHGQAIIAAGSDAGSTSVAISALTGFFNHITGASLAEEGMLLADRQLRRGYVQEAAKNIEKAINGLRLDGSTSVFVPVKDFVPEFPDLLRQEFKETQNLLKTMRQGASEEEVKEQFQKVASFCAYCHVKHVSYDRQAQNRVLFHYSQFPETRMETEWARAYTLKQGKMVKAR